MNHDRVKFSVFADLHHYPGVFHTEAPRRLKEIQERAMRENVDFMVQLGDFCHIPDRHRDIIDQYNRFPIPGFHVLGNHDTDGSSLETTLDLYEMPGMYYHFDMRGFRFIVLDTNFYRHGRGYTHFEFRNYFDFPDTRETLPPEELDYLRDTLEDSPYPCVLLSHSSLERETGGVRNREAVRDIIRQANSRKPKVLLAINGHHHRDNLRIIDAVPYLDLNSASFEWLAVPHRLFPEELRRDFELIDHQVIWHDPIHAVISLDGSGSIVIEGMQSSMFHGVTREMTSNPPCDGDGRLAVPGVLSCGLRLWGI